MELSIGLGVGSILGILLSFIPGFNTGLGFIGAELIPYPRFAIGLVIGVELTHSALKHLSLLHCKDREDLDESITQSDNKIELMLTSTSSYVTIKIIACLVFGVVILAQGNKIFDIEIVRHLSLGIGLIIWFTLINMAKHWKIAVIGFVMYGIFAFTTIELPINQPIFVLASSLFSANLINEFRYKPEKVKLVNLNTLPEVSSPWAINGMWAGLVSGFLWGLPTNALCKLLQEKDDCPAKEVSRHAIADAITSVLGLTLFLTIGGSRSASASTLIKFKESFHQYEIFWILITSALFTGLIYYFWNEITNLYIKLYNNTPHFVKRLTILITIIGLTIMSNGWFFVTAIIALMLNKIVKIAEAPRELSLSPIGILPLANLIKIW